MSKVENNHMFGSVTDVQYNSEKWNPAHLIGRYTAKIEDIFIRQGYIMVVLGFLLGRALILSQLTPFSLPFFAAVYMMKRVLRLKHLKQLLLLQLKKEMLNKYLI